MRKVFAAAVIAVCAGSAAAHPPPSDTVIPLDLSGVRPAVEFSVGDRPPALAVFDTGSMFNLIDMERAREFGLPNEGTPRPQFARGGAFETTIVDARIGNVRLSAIEATATPWTILPDRLAILSPNIFAGNLVTLDFTAGELRITRKPAHEPAGEVYAYGDPPLVMPRIPVQIGSEAISALLDTGSAYTLLFPLADAERLPLAEPLVESGMVHGHRGDYPVFTSRIAGVVRVGPLTVENPEARFTDAVPFANVGMDYLRQLTITLDPEERRLWVRRNPAN